MEELVPDLPRSDTDTREIWLRVSCNMVVTMLVKSRKYYLRDIYSGPETFLLPFIILYIIIPCHKLKALKLKRQGNGKLISFLKSSTMLLITSEYN